MKPFNFETSTWDLIAAHLLNVINICAKQGNSLDMSMTYNSFLKCVTFKIGMKLDCYDNSNKLMYSNRQNSAASYILLQVCSFNSVLSVINSNYNV